MEKPSYISEFEVLKTRVAILEKLVLSLIGSSPEKIKDVKSIHYSNQSKNTTDLYNIRRRFY
jgi:hypothetical protein